MSNLNVRSASTVEDQPDPILDTIIREHLKGQNDLEYELSDKLDAKMNIALVVITFLGTQSGTFFAFTAMPQHWHLLQIGSVACLALAGSAAVIGLIPRVYKVGLAPQEFITWVEGVKDYYKADTVAESEAKSIAFINRKGVGQMLERYAHNRSLNASKSVLVTCSYILTSLALAINVLTLIALASKWRF